MKKPLANGHSNIKTRPIHADVQHQCVTVMPTVTVMIPIHLRDVIPPNAEKSMFIHTYKKYKL